jgi:hypothetical protein
MGLLVQMNYVDRVELTHASDAVGD